MDEEEVKCGTFDFESVVKEYQAGLRAFIRSLGADEDWVDDLAQEVFLVAYRKQSEFRQDEDPGKWLRGIARRLVMGDRTKRARRHRLMHEGIADILINLGIEKPIQDSDLHATVAVMKTCVGGLPDLQRNLLQERYQQGRKAKELAEIKSTTAAAIRKKLQRIRQLIRSCMESKLGEISI